MCVCVCVCVISAVIAWRFKFEFGIRSGAHLKVRNHVKSTLLIYSCSFISNNVCHRFACPWMFLNELIL